MSNYFKESLIEVGSQSQSSVDMAAVLGIVEHTEYPFAKGALTTDGIQYSAPIEAATGTTNYTVQSTTIDPDCDGAIIECYLNLQAAFKATASTTADIIYQWQARNNAGTWVNLHAAQTLTDVGAAYVDATVSGRFATETNFNAVPFDIQLIFQCNETAEGWAKTKNSSYLTTIYKAY